MIRNGRQYYRGSVRQALAMVMVCGLFLAAAPGIAGEPEWGKNLVTNPSFETGDDFPWYWARRIGAHQPGDEVLSMARFGSKVIHSGSRSLLLYGTSETTRWRAIESQWARVRPGGWYKLSGWILTSEVRQEEGQYFNCNLYVQFMDADEKTIPVMQSLVVATQPLSGTQKWTRVERIVRAPDAARHALVGCVLTCSGTAWFDDVALQERSDPDWKQKDTERFVFLFEGSDAPGADEMKSMEEHLISVEKALGLKHERKIRYYKYESKHRKEQLTGNASEIHYEPGEIHATTWRERNAIVHVLMKTLGDGTPFFAVGITIHLSGSWVGMDIDEYVGELATRGGLLPLKHYQDAGVFNQLPRRVAYPQAASFVGFLIREFGVDRFKKIYPAPKPNESLDELNVRFRAVYGDDLETVEKAWLAYLFPSSG